MCLKVFDLDKTQMEGTSTSAAVPDCVQILRVFTNQFPEAKVMSTSFSVFFLLQTCF